MPTKYNKIWLGKTWINERSYACKHEKRATIIRANLKQHMLIYPIKGSLYDKQQKAPSSLPIFSRDSFPFSTFFLWL